MARSLRVSALCVALGAALLAGCGTTNNIVFDLDAGPGDAGMDAGPDGGTKT